MPSLNLKTMHKIIAEELVFQMFKTMPLEMDVELSEELAKKCALVTMDYLIHSLEPEDTLMKNDFLQIIEIIKEI